MFIIVARHRYLTGTVEYCGPFPDENSAKKYGRLAFSPEKYTVHTMPMFRPHVFDVLISVRPSSPTFSVQAHMHVKNG